MGALHFFASVIVNRGRLPERRITITDDDRDGTDPLGLITFLKPECEATFGG